MVIVSLTGGARNRKREWRIAGQASGRSPAGQASAVERWHRGCSNYWQRCARSPPWQADENLESSLHHGREALVASRLAFYIDWRWACAGRGIV